jgi:hypothetical protein
MIAIKESNKTRWKQTLYYILFQRNEKFMRKDIFTALYPALMLLMLVLGYLSNFSRRQFLYSGKAKEEILMLLPVVIIVVVASAYNLYAILSNKKSKIIRIACFVLISIICTVTGYISYRLNNFGHTLVYALLVPFIFYGVYKTIKV